MKGNRRNRLRFYVHGRKTLVTQSPSVVFVFALAVTLIGQGRCWGSDHADPIDPLNKLRQEGGLTDLYVFPILADGRPAYPFSRESQLPLHKPSADVVRKPLTKQQQSEIAGLVFILCLHRRLDDLEDLELEAYRYEIHIDTHTNLEFPSSESADSGLVEHPSDPSDNRTPDENDRGNRALPVVEAYARYGGLISDPESIRADFTMAFELQNDATMKPGFPEWPSSWDARRIEVESGLFDDPFIFPMFFGSNVIAIVVRVPVDMFPKNRTEFLVWAESRTDGEKIDHVGRSVRTQSPRFELLNTLPPSKHVKALIEEHEHPSLTRDIALRLNLASLFAYRRWDFVPDVLCFSKRYPAGFPNGRLLTDDVAAMLAQHGETLLFELSYQDDRYRWPRQTANDRVPFKTAFPYLREPHETIEQRPPPRLSDRSLVKLIALAVLFLTVIGSSHLLFARWYHRRKLRRRYL